MEGPAEAAALPQVHLVVGDEHGRRAEHAPEERGIGLAGMQRAIVAVEDRPDVLRVDQVDERAETAEPDGESVAVAAVARVEEPRQLGHAQRLEGRWPARTRRERVFHRVCNIRLYKTSV